LDEKRGELHDLRAVLHDISSRQPDLVDLKLKASQIEPEDAEKAMNVTDSLAQQYNHLLSKAEAFVNKYEGIVCNASNYMKAVQETQEWLEGTNNTISLWGDENQDITSCRSNLDKLQVFSGHCQLSAVRIPGVYRNRRRILIQYCVISEFAPDIARREPNRRN
jgi:nesprin-1